LRSSFWISGSFLWENLVCSKNLTPDVRSSPDNREKVEPLRCFAQAMDVRMAEVPVGHHGAELPKGQGASLHHRLRRALHGYGEAKPHVTALPR
jgi:hypothetical protein